MAIAILMPGIFATVLWFALVRRIGAVKAATFHFLNPFFGVVIAALVLGEGIQDVRHAGRGRGHGGHPCGQVSRQAV